MKLLTADLLHSTTALIIALRNLVLMFRTPNLSLAHESANINNHLPSEFLIFPPPFSSSLDYTLILSVLMSRSPGHGDANPN